APAARVVGDQRGLPHAPIHPVRIDPRDHALRSRPMIALTILASTIAQPALSPLAQFAGHCWTGEAPGGAGTDTHCFEAALGGEHIRDRHTVKVHGKIVYAGEALYSVEQGAITFTYWNSLGGVGRGTAQPDGNRIAFSG